MTPQELAALRARFPELAGMGEADAAQYLNSRFPVGRSAPQTAMPPPSAAPSGASRAFNVTAPDGRVFRVTGGPDATMEGAVAAVKKMPSSPPQIPAPNVWQRGDDALAWTKQAAAATMAGKAIEVQLPDGTMLEFPAGTDEATMRRAITENFPQFTKQGAQAQPSANPFERFRSDANPFAQFAPGASGGQAGGRTNEDIRGMVLDALGRVDRSQAMRGRIAAAKAGTLPMQAGSAERAQEADAASARKMASPNANMLDELGYSPDDYRAFAERAAVAGQPEWQRRLMQMADELDAANRQKMTPGVAGGTVGALADGVTFGFGDEFMGGVAAALGVQPDGQGGTRWFDYSRPIAERYAIARDTLRTEQAGYKEARPIASTAAEVVGSFAVPGKAVGGFINGGATTGARVARGAVAGAGMGAAYGFGEGEGGAGNRATEALQGAAVGAATGGGLTLIGQGINAAIRAASRAPELRAAVPTLEGLRQTAQGLYAKAEEMGGQLPADDVARMTAGIGTKIKEAGFDRQLHPRVAAVVDRLTSETGPKSLQEMEILRRVATNASASLQPDERRIAMQVVDAIDDAVDGMGGGSASLKAAREVWTRLRRMETIDEAINKAALTDDFAAGLRTQCKALLRNPRRLRGFKPDQINAITYVAKGGAIPNGLRWMGKALSPTGLSGVALTGGALASGAGVGSLAIPVAGAGMSAMAGRIVAKAADKARTMAGQDDATRALLERLIRGPNLNALAPTVPGLMGGWAAQDWPQ